MICLLINFEWHEWETIDFPFIRQLPIMIDYLIIPIAEIVEMADIAKA